MGERAAGAAIRSLVAGAVLLGAGCGPADPGPGAGPDSEDGDAAAVVRSRIDETVAAFFAAYEAGDADSVVTFFADDARLMAPGAPTVRGTADLAANLGVGMSMGRRGVT